MQLSPFDKQAEHRLDAIRSAIHRQFRRDQSVDPSGALQERIKRAARCSIGELFNEQFGSFEQICKYEIPIPFAQSEISEKIGFNVAIKRENTQITAPKPNRMSKPSCLRPPTRLTLKRERVADERHREELGMRKSKIASTFSFDNDCTHIDKLVGVGVAGRSSLFSKAWNPIMRNGRSHDALLGFSASKSVISLS